MSSRQAVDIDDAKSEGSMDSTFSDSQNSHALSYNSGMKKITIQLPQQTKVEGSITQAEVLHSVEQPDEDKLTYTISEENIQEEDISSPVVESVHQIANDVAVSSDSESIASSRDKNTKSGAPFLYYHYVPYNVMTAVDVKRLLPNRVAERSKTRIVTRVPTAAKQVSRWPSSECNSLRSLTCHLADLSMYYRDDYSTKLLPLKRRQLRHDESQSRDSTKPSTRRGCLKNTRKNSDSNNKTDVASYDRPELRTSVPDITPQRGDTRCHKSPSNNILNVRSIDECPQSWRFSPRRPHTGYPDYSSTEINGDAISIDMPTSNRKTRKAHAKLDIGEQYNNRWRKTEVIVERKPQTERRMRLLRNQVKLYLQWKEEEMQRNRGKYSKSQTAREHLHSFAEQRRTFVDMSNANSEIFDSALESRNSINSDNDVVRESNKLTEMFKLLQ